MPIPKVIHQTYKTKNLPVITRFFIWWMRRVNPDYKYEFYDDQRVSEFIKNEFSIDYYKAYSKLDIGAAKGDFFRYAVLYKRGGVYVDVDGAIVRPLSLIISEQDAAIITRERDHPYFVQWALIFEPQHPFLAKALEICVQNINSNSYPYNVHQMTGPSVFTQAIKECLAKDSSIRYREFGIDYERVKKQVIIPKHFLNSFLYFGDTHWAKEKRPVLKNTAPSMF